MTYIGAFYIERFKLAVSPSFRLEKKIRIEEILKNYGMKSSCT
jgi:hypothetical protein